MKRPILLLFTLLLVGLTAGAQTPPALSPGARLLFANVKSRLTVAEKNQVFKALGFSLSPKREKYQEFIASANSRDFPFGANVYPTDVNQDGIEELFVVYGNDFTSGRTGSSVVLFIKPSGGRYQKNLDFPGAPPDVLTTANLGYPDLLIGGPGFEFPVWRWNGKAYDHHRKIKDADYEKTPKTGLEAVSRAYVNKL